MIVALERLGRYAEACQKHAKAAEIDPRHAKAYFGWGLALALMRKRAEAEEKLNGAAQLEPELERQIEKIRKQLLGEE